MKPKQPFLISPVKPGIRSSSSRQFVAKRHNLALKKIKGKINGESSKLKMQRHKVVGNLNREVYECLEYLIEDEEIVLQNKAAENYIIIESSNSLHDIDSVGTIECANGGQKEAKEEKCEGQDVRFAKKEKSSAKIKLEDTPRHKLADNSKHILVDSAKRKLEGNSKLKFDYNTKVKLNDSVKHKLEDSTKYKSDDNKEEKLEDILKMKLDYTPKLKLSENPKQKMGNTLKHKLSDTVKRKLGNTLKRKSGDTPKHTTFKRKLGSAPKHKLNVTSKRKLDSAPKRMLGESAKHKVDNSVKHKLGNASGYKFGYTVKHKLDDTPLPMLDDSGKHMVDDDANKNLNDSAEIKLEDNTIPEDEMAVTDVLYQQLWDQATDTRLPSLLWSLHRELNGRFVAFVHLSEDSTRISMSTDKMVMFEERCRPVIFLRGVKIINIVNIPEELESLEQVAAILRRVDRLVLCEGMVGSNKRSMFSADCHIYLDKVKDGLTCKACELEEKTSNIKVHKRKSVGL